MLVNFLQEQLPPLLKNVLLNIRPVMWFLQDGASSHFNMQVRKHLNAVFLSPGLIEVYVSEFAIIKDLSQCIEVVVTDLRHHQPENL